MSKHGNGLRDLANKFFLFAVALPDELSSLTKLETVTVANNLLRSLPSMTNWKALRQLDARY